MTKLQVTLVPQGTGTCPVCDDDVELYTVMCTMDGVGETRLSCTECMQDGQVVEIEQAPEVAPKNQAKRRRKISIKGEKAVAKRMGGQVQRASGALPWAKGDFTVSGKYRGEVKYTEAESYRVTLEDLHKLQSYTRFPEVSLFVVQFVEKGTSKIAEEWVLLPVGDFKRITEAK